MKRLFALAAALALLSACGSAPEPEGDSRIFPYDTQTRDLPNGLRAVTVKTPYPNIVALYVVVQVGSRNEVEPGRSGFAHLFEHMMFRGTERFPSEKWEKIMQAAGAETNAYTTDDRTVYHAVFSKEDLEPIVDLEADRFQNLKYSEEIFRTETRAVLSEYNKSFADPMRKLDEQLRNKAFTTHTYKHTTMGFIEDVEAMPEMYEYGLEFFHRYYRPGYTVVSIVGDIEHEQAQALIEKYWGPWEKGNYKAPIPAEPPAPAPQTIDIDFHAPTLPLLAVSFQAPAYDDEIPDSAVLDLISFQTFGENSELYKRLVFEEQKVDVLYPGYYDHVDPYLFSIVARVKNPADVADVEQQILAEIEKLKNEPVPAEELEKVKSHLRYQFALSMDSTSAIADTLAHYLGLRRDPETINRRYRLYQQVTPEQMQAVAKKVFVETGRTIATLETAGQGGKSE
jgi:zinc protease